MKKLLKKGVCIIFTAVIFVFLFSVSAGAKTPPIYDLGDFTGEESMSVDLKYDYASFAGLEDNDGEIASENYSVSGDEQKTTVTLNKEYLNNLENGEYRLKAYFENVEMKSEFEAAEDVGVFVSADENSEFVKLTAGETEVDKANYDVKKESGGFLITVKNEFLQTLPENTVFCAYYREESMCYLRLRVEKQTEASADATEPEKTEQPADRDASLVSPKTGDSSLARLLIPIMLISVSVIALVFTFSRKLR